MLRSLRCGAPTLLASNFHSSLTQPSSVYRSANQQRTARPRGSAITPAAPEQDCSGPYLTPVFTMSKFGAMIMGPAGAGKVCNHMSSIIVYFPNSFAYRQEKHLLRQYCTVHLLRCPHYPPAAESPLCLLRQPRSRRRVLRAHSRPRHQGAHLAQRCYGRGWPRA